jgi:hypothetical protein
MSFRKILVANRGDKRGRAALAVKGHIALADVSRSHIAWHAQRAAISSRSHHVH